MTSSAVSRSTVPPIPPRSIRNGSVTSNNTPPARHVFPSGHTQRAATKELQWCVNRKQLFRQQPTRAQRRHRAAMLPVTTTPRAAELLGTLQHRETTTDEELIPARAVLIEEQDGLPGRADPGARAGRLDLHQRDEAVHLRLPRSELGQDTTQTQRGA
jgi:hypothetical protein